MNLIHNPILRGFNPDPSIVRVGADYYIATSTFEWFPGVQIHHSRDLKSWRLITRPLRRASQIDLRGDPDSCGVWAADLSHADGRFHLVYTDVKRYGRTTINGATGVALRDFHNYWVWCDRIDGDWSDPVYLNSSGFDPALFHDDDGSTWLLNMLWDHRPDRRRFAGIVAQQFDLGAGKLIGERRVIFEGTELGFTEGPHLYKRDGWYHLLVAEGGTGWNHAVVMARSRSLYGPYEPHPDGPILTVRSSDAALARTGHGDLVDTPTGETWMAYLCGRPLPGKERCVLGRETAIQPMMWGEDGWLRTLGGTGAPSLKAPVPAGLPIAESTPHVRQLDQFDDETLPADFQWLRTPYPDAIFSLTARPGHLRLYGRESIGSAFTQALVARRQQSFSYSAEVSVAFEPDNFQQAAGLVCYYNSTKFHYLFISTDEENGRYVGVMSALPSETHGSAFSTPIPIPSGVIHLRVDVAFESLRFSYRMASASDWTPVPGTFDASILSDEATITGLPNFTGTFVGMACQDLSGCAIAADFDYFAYSEG
ncbi:glycoside hydrolase family 43 protein [Sphingomonas nostoxanthinifaciens]|uniref:glycoside hydrolase family 43 protein n=1 Tax=Sphingomonas nostoxanthinifaciens TaxID=2872652 RepID=UPI001CC1F9A5|nr:glycoside hydrolase family 43 protein [Sphingomonas nostoxanthinifaciens]UAK25824.1 glycoside hydrolase family 43 protein [Sphingomonas nostoxanthinifaciens]